jgi:hypothetical protein
VFLPYPLLIFDLFQLGWLLRHPIKKLYHFQQYHIEQQLQEQHLQRAAAEEVAETEVQ